VTKLLIATSNPAKLSEYKLLLRDYNFDLISLTDLGIRDAPNETGATFAENALLKARYYFARAEIATLADDGGLEIDALGGAPGVLSHRWAGEGATDEELVRQVMAQLHDVEDPREARLRSAMALIYPHGGGLREHVTEASLQGVIPKRSFRKMRPGFPYRAVLFLPERGRYVAELSEDEETALSQRRITVERAHSWLLEIASAGEPAGQPKEPS
jgi:XTP/dITP diphosphohydrolase